MTSPMEVQQPWVGLQDAQAGLEHLEREICGGADLNFDLFLSRLQESGQRQCTSVWTRGTIAYRCRSCQVNESSAICVTCFQAGDHKDHDYVMYRSEAGGCCDCGDDASWKAEGNSFCDIHRRFVGDKVACLPVQVAAAASGAVRRVLKELIICVKEIYRMRTADGALPLEIDISQTALLIRWSQKICSVESLRDILCAEMMVNLPTVVAFDSLIKPLEILLFTFAKMPDPLMEGDMILPFVHAAPSAEAASGFKALDQSLDRVMVQLFNVPETTLAFIKHNGLLECFLSALVSVMSHCIDRNVGTVNAEHKTISAKIYARPQGDLRLMLSHPAVALYVLLEREDIVKQLLSLLSQLQWMNPYTQNQDIDFEEQHSWKNAIQLEMGTMAIVFQLIGRSSALSQSNEETCRTALLQFARSTLQELLKILSKVKITRGPFNGLSLHIPLHRTLSAIVSKLVLMHWGEADQGFISELQASLSEAEVLSLMEHPLRILAWMSQVRVRQGHMNPESFGRLELIYRGSFWHDQSMDMDLLMLQFCCVVREHMEQTIFLSLAEQFDLLSMVTRPAYVGRQPTKNLTTEKIAFLQEFMRLILLVVRDRHNTGMTENESLRYDVIQWLCARDTTFSQLYNCVNGFTTDHAKLSVMLQEVAVYIAPKLQERGCYQLKQECWVEFDPLFAQFYSNDLEDAQERAASIGKLEHFWRLPLPPQARPPFDRLINLLHTEACSLLIWNVLYHVTILVKEESTATAAEALGVTALQMLAMVLADAREGSSKPRKVSPSSGTRHAGAPSASSLDHVYDNIYGLPFLNPDTGVLEWRRGESTAPTIHRMLLGLQKTKDSIRLVDSIMHVLLLLPSYDSRTDVDVTSISYPQMVDLSMEDERRKLKKQRQEAILKDFAARQKAFIEQQDVDQVLSKEVVVEQPVNELGDFGSPVQAESSAADDAGSMLLSTDHSYHPRECAFCRCSCDGKDSGWIALVQRYNLADVMVSRAEVVQDIEEELLSVVDNSLVAVAASFKGEPAKSTAIDVYPAEHVRCCGHQMHQTCFQRYVDSLVKRHNARCPYEGRGIIDLSRMEFLCPICRRLANVLLPDINASLAWNRVQQDHDDDEPSTSGGNTQQYGLDGGPDADISVVLYGEKDGAEEYWTEFWQANHNLAEVISVFASQCLRVRKNFRMEPPELKGFMLCRVLWEVLAANIVHAEVEMRSEVARPLGQEASSSTSSEIRDGYLCRGDGAHWLALQQLGRLAMLANTLPAAAGAKDREVLKLQESFGMYSRSQQGASEKGKGLVVEAKPDSNNMSSFASAVPRDDSQSQSSSDDSEMLDERTDESVPTAIIEVVQDEVEWKCCHREQFGQSTEEYWLWNFSTTISGGVLATDSFGLLITLLVAMRGCPSLVQLLALVHLAHFVCYSQGLLAIGALNRSDSSVGCVENLNRTTCIPFLRRAALLVEVLTGKRMTGCDGYRDLDFVFLERWLRLQNPEKVQHITINGVQMEINRLQQTWQERLDSWMLETFLLKIPRLISFVRLPDIFQDLMLQRLKTPCSNCNEVPGEPAICLACGKLFCYGRVKEGRGECYNHAAEGGCSSVGIFLLLHSTQLLLLRNERVCVAPSLYLDLHGEEDLDAGLKRGHLLHLSHLRLKEITRLWATASLDYDTHTLHTSQLRGKIC